MYLIESCFFVELSSLLQRLGETLSIQDLIEILEGNCGPLGNTLPVWRSLDSLLLQQHNPSLMDFRARASDLLSDFPFQYEGANAEMVLSELRRELIDVFSMFLRRLHFYLVASFFIQNDVNID